MNKNSTLMLFYFFLILGIMISLSANNWLSCWLGIEMNLVSFLPIINKNHDMYSSESTIKYFIVQGMSSSMFFMSIILMNMMLNSDMFIMISLLIKLGCAPFHMWFTSVMEGLSWTSCMILCTVQKLVPLILLSYLNNSSIEFFIIMTMIIGSLGGLNYSSLRKIMSYSSIYNMGWIMIGLYLDSYSWFVYFLVYSIMLLMICHVFNYLNLSYINQYVLMNMTFMNKLIIMLMMLSMGGMPPLLGFLPKVIMIQPMILMKMYFLSIISVMSALFVLFFYMRMILTSYMINTFSLKWMYNMVNLNMLSLFGVISMMGLFSIGFINLWM
uniref:NADH-ubiquinone oxidoreductase chain 2 n=1 Tax=Tettigarcta crinita TaxID=295286 RepID=A0A3Q8GK09_9HEMI|nr:NADH dehydrogenase subunit 2 [Tettigarcta crinita]